MSTDIVSIPFHGAQIIALEDDETRWVSPRHVCETIGIAFSKQLQKLKSKSWARVSLKDTRDSSGRTQQITMIDRKTFTMWLATIETSRVRNDDARKMVEAFQNEAADALDAYFSQGVAVNPRMVDEDPAERNLRLSRGQLELIQLASSIAPSLAPAYIETMASIALEKGLGQMPHVAPEDQGLYTEDYLKERGHSGAQLKSLRSQFGRLVSVEYQKRHGCPPMKSVGEVGGRARPINYYTERDRGLFDHVYNTQLAPKIGVLA